MERSLWCFLNRQSQSHCAGDEQAQERSAAATATAVTGRNQSAADPSKQRESSTTGENRQSMKAKFARGRLAPRARTGDLSPLWAEFVESYHAVLRPGSQDRLAKGDRLRDCPGPRYPARAGLEGAKQPGHGAGEGVGKPGLGPPRTVPGPVIAAGGVIERAGYALAASPASRSCPGPVPRSPRTASGCRYRRRPLRAGPVQTSSQRDARAPEAYSRMYS